MSSVKIVFFGTPVFAAEILRYLLQHNVSVLAVVTQPDKPKGRSLQVSFSPVKAAIHDIAPEIPVYQPIKASEEQFLKTLADIQADLFVVVAYGQILSQRLLDIPRLGCINVHASLLPKYRGAAPIHRCILSGERESGIAIQKMVRQLDAGDVIAVSKTPIPLEMTFGELEQKLCDLAKPLLVSVIRDYEKGIPPATPQDSSQATYASKIELNEGEIDWKKPAEEIHNLIRAFSPRPGAWCWVESGDERKRLKILRSELVEQPGYLSCQPSSEPGTLLSNAGLVACGQHAVRLIAVQPEGKKPMNAADWLRGQKKQIKFF